MISSQSGNARPAFAQEAGTDSRRRILFVLAEDAWFWTHRLPLARAARAAGLRVGVVTNASSSAARMQEEGFEYFHHDFRRAGIHPLHDLNSVRRLAGLYSKFRPDVVHHVAMKPVIFGSIAARLAGVPATVNAVAGLGFALSSGSSVARLIRPVVRAGLRLALAHPNSRLIVQNRDDARYFVSKRLAGADKIRLVRGVGVCVQDFTVTPEPEGVPLIVLPSRLLGDKGVREFVDAARYIRQIGVAARFALVGTTDLNPTSLTPSEVEGIAREGVVEVWGHRHDMQAVYRSANIVCLPSYREGLPKVLLEAAASGRAIVATDVPGCREVVRNGETGLLVPAREVEPLVGALLCLIRDRELRQRFGAAGRQLVMRQFTEDKAIDDTFAVYSEVLGTPIRRRLTQPVPPSTASTASTAPVRIPGPTEAALAEPLGHRASDSS